jgi:putative addiction module component (TIGR02574 family)
MATPLFDFTHLSPAERIQLAEDLWDSLPPESDMPELTAAQRAELDRRLVEYERDPAGGEPWETVRARLLKDRERGG